MARCVPSGPRYYDVDVMPISEARWTILTYTQGPFIALTVVGQGGYAVCARGGSAGTGTRNSEPHRTSTRRRCIF
jgi:hypothetical protein